MHLAIGHYSIGACDGVNTVIWRTVTELRKFNPELRITLFGKVTKEIDDFLPWQAGKLTYRNIEEISPDYHIPGLEGKSIQYQRAHDYIWHGTNVAEKLQQQFADADIVMMENLSVGVNPSVTYAFYLWTLWEYQAKSNKRFFVRVHDFAQQRPANFDNVKKFQAFLPSEMPDWHQILYPSTPNIEYMAINTYDYYRLLDHGVEPQRVWYVPNSIDNSLASTCIPSETTDQKDNGSATQRTAEGPSAAEPSHQLTGPCRQLRRLLETEKGIDPQAAILYYPVRAIPRKNVEEAIYLLNLLNKLAKTPEYREKYDLAQEYHLVVSLGGGSEDEKKYTQILQEFVKQSSADYPNGMPVTIDISDLVGLHRQYDPDEPARIVKYGVADMYSLAHTTVSTSVMEGFGFVFIEPWVVGQCVIGRNIPTVTMDFVKAGISLDHLYSALLVNGLDYVDVGTDQSDGGLNLRLQEILKLKDMEYLRKILNKNSASLRATLKLFRHERRRNPRRNLIAINRKMVLENYSSKAVVGLLNRIILHQEPSYIEPRPGTHQIGKSRMPKQTKMAANIEY